MRAQMLAIRAKRVITPLQDLRDAVVLVEGDTICATGRQINLPVPEGAALLDVGDKIVVPGFVDLHHHGAVGFKADEGVEAVKAIGHYMVQTGTTSWLPTVQKMEAVSDIVAAMREGTGGADVLGIHMEGPYLAPKGIPGRDDMDSILRKPSLAEFDACVEAAAGNLRLMGIAPELEGALDLIREMRRVGVVPAVAHTKATYEQFMRAVEAGARHATHAYNVMTGLHHRRPNVVGGILTCDQVTAELIADGYHVSPPAMDILLRCKGYDKVAVITDCVPIAGLPDGTYEVSGMTVVKKDGIIRHSGADAERDNTMAGSEWPMNHNLRILTELVHVPLAAAIRMATLTPATIIDVNKRKGSIEPGKDADLVVIDQQLEVHMTMVRGKVVYQRPAVSCP
ncbi:MAG: N-acetylglucosamine-6-phosphate deacetylase [Anaerolineae bacterium]